MPMSTTACTAWSVAGASAACSTIFARAHLNGTDLAAGYAAMAADEAREAEADRLEREPDPRCRPRTGSRGMPEPAPRRGEVWLVSFDPAIGSEIPEDPARRGAEQ